jgi:hypothetical protein
MSSRRRSSMLERRQQGFLFVEHPWTAVVFAGWTHTLDRVHFTAINSCSCACVAARRVFWPCLGRALLLFRLIQRCHANAMLHTGPQDNRVSGHQGITTRLTSSVLHVAKHVPAHVMPPSEPLASHGTPAGRSCLLGPLPCPSRPFETREAPLSTFHLSSPFV